MSKSARRYLLIGLFFSCAAVVLALLYYFKVIRYLDLYLSVIYIMYLLGLALVFNGVYNRDKNHPSVISKRANYIVGGLCILGSIGMLIYGLVSGQVELFKILI